MKKVTKALASGALGLTLALGGNLGAAQAAEAATTSYYTAYYGPGNCWRVAYTDYNWWEETFQGKRDSTIRLYPVTCPNINIISVG